MPDNLPAIGQLSSTEDIPQSNSSDLANLLQNSQLPSATNDGRVQPETVQIQGQELPVSQVETLVSKGREADSLRLQLAELKEELHQYSALASVVNGLSQENLQLVVAYLQQVKADQDSGRITRPDNRKPLTFNPSETYQRISEKEMTDGEATAYEFAVNESLYLRAQIAQLAEVVQQQANVLAKFGQQTEEQALQAEFGVTLEQIRELRRNGVSDLRKFLSTYPVSAKNPAQAGPTDQAMPPMPPSKNNGRSTYSLFGPNAPTPDLVKLRGLWDQGIYPDNPKDRAWLASQLGVPMPRAS